MKKWTPKKITTPKPDLLCYGKARMKATLIDQCRRGLNGKYGKQKGFRSVDRLEERVGRLRSLYHFICVRWVNDRLCVIPISNPYQAISPYSSERVDCGYATSGLLLVTSSFIDD